MDLPSLYQAYLVADMKQIILQLQNDMISSGQKSILIVIVLANAKKSFIKSEILPLIEYWNFRSKNHVTFFFPGYIGLEHFNISNPDKVEHYFKEKVFVQLIEQIEKTTSWKYSGDTPIILCASYLQYDQKLKKNYAYIDFGSVIEFKLEQALKEGLINSVESFFETLIDIAKELPGFKAHWKLSDIYGLKTLGESLLEIFAPKLSKSTRKLAKTIQYFGIKNID